MFEYLDKGYFPGWVPNAIRRKIDTSELAIPDPEIEATANLLMELLQVNIAVYVAYADAKSGKPNGLCQVFKAANLEVGQLMTLKHFERLQGKYIIIAYARPVKFLKSTLSSDFPT
ncbi:MAG: hypothetical protein REI78_13495 [Pedobacter sp.]|nr:hypothetical protein [Pedobacter sp.]